MRAGSSLGTVQTRLLAACVRAIARAAPEPLRSALRLDGACTVLDVAARENRRHGATAGLRAGALELIALLLTVLRARARRSIPITAGAPVRQPVPRRPSMFIDDVRHALRRLRSRPLNVLAAASLLALAIGLTTAMFTLADTLLLRPVPFPHADRLAQVFMGTRNGGSYAVSPAVLRAWRESPAFEAVESAASGTALLGGPAGPQVVGTATVTTGLFDMLDVRAVRGRLFVEGDGRAGTDDLVVISEDLWRGAFGADADIIGRRITVDGAAAQVVGVLPSDVRFPEWNTLLWRPVDLFAPPPGVISPQSISYARFAAGLPREEAEALATRAAQDADPAMADRFLYAQAFAGLRLDAYYERAVPLMGAGVALVFVVLCANVAAMLLMRFTARRREFATCSALGASRLRLLRQALFENALLGLIGCAGGIALAWALIGLAKGFLPEAFLLRTLNPLSLDLRALAAASAAGVAALVLAGVLPAWIGTRPSGGTALGAGERAGTDHRAARTVTRGLIVVEIALACTLLFGALLLVRSFANLTDADRGLDTAGVMTATLSLDTERLPDRAARLAMTDAVERAIRGMPGITDFALSFGLPPDGGELHFGSFVSDDASVAPRDGLVVDAYVVDDAFFDFYRIPILSGRAFRAGEADVVVVGERLAGILWPGQTPVGRSFTRSNRSYRVVGLAREINLPSLDAQVDRPEFYRPLALAPDGTVGLRGNSYLMASIRCGDACPDGALIRERLLAVGPGLTVQVGPLDDEYFQQLAQPRAAAALASTFAIVALIAAAGGLFGVLSYAVARRRHEFGIRHALGASQAQLRWQVMREGLVVTGVGLALGGAAGLVLTRALASFQYGVTGADPVSWITVAATLAAAALLASSLPAVQASRVQPSELLRD